MSRQPSPPGVVLTDTSVGEGDAYLTVEADGEDHEEEQDGPELGDGHMDHSLGVDHKHQAWSWAKQRATTKTGLIGFFILLIF